MLYQSESISILKSTQIVASKFLYTSLVFMNIRKAQNIYIAPGKPIDDGQATINTICKTIFCFNV